MTKKQLDEYLSKIVKILIDEVDMWPHPELLKIVREYSNKLSEEADRKIKIIEKRLERIKQEQIETFKQMGIHPN